MSEQTVLKIQPVEGQAIPSAYPFLRGFQVSHVWPRTGKQESRVLWLPENILSFSGNKDAGLEKLLGWVLYWSLRLWNDNSSSKQKGPLETESSEDVGYFPFTLNLITQYNRRQEENPEQVEGFWVEALTDNGWVKGEVLSGWSLPEVEYLKDKSQQEMTQLVSKHALANWEE